MHVSLTRQPTAILPIVMSAGALTTVLCHAALYGIARQADEGAAAHIWQLLMAGQIKWLPRAPTAAAQVLAVQAGAAVAALAPIDWFGW